MMKYRIKEIIYDSGSKFQIQSFFLWWSDMKESKPRRDGDEVYEYSTIEEAEDRINQLQHSEPTRVKYHY